MRDKGAESHDEAIPTVTSLRDFPFDQLHQITSIRCPTVVDSHVSVLCAIKGISILQPGVPWSGTTRAQSLSELEDQAIQLSVLDDLDIKRAKAWQNVSQFFVRWEHILYRQHHSMGGQAEVLLAQSAQEIQTLANEAKPKPLVLRIPDVRSDDPLARAFNLGMEGNPALGLHGNRYWLTAPERLINALKDAVSDAPPNLRLAVPFVSNAREFFDLQERLDLGSLVPFIETPSFVWQVSSYRNVPSIGIGLKDFSYLLMGLDRESNVLLPAQGEAILALGARALAPTLRKLIDEGTVVSLYTPIGMQRMFLEILERSEWVASMPIGSIKESQRG